MKWNAFSLIEPAIEKTSKLLFPFNIKLWTKLGIVASISRYRAMGRGGTGWNAPNSFSNTDSANPGMRGITGKIIDEGKIISGGLIAGIVAFFAFLWLILNYIASMCTFIFIDALAGSKKEFYFRKGWSEQKNLGMSLFGFSVILGLISLVVYALAALPFLLIIFNTGIKEYFMQITFFSFIRDIAFTLIVGVAYSLVLGIFNVLFYGFAVPHSYKTKIGVWNAFKEIWPRVKQQKKEAFVYVLSRIVISICLAMISIIGLIIGAVALLIPGAIIGIALYLILTGSTLFWIILAGIVLIAIVALIYYMILFSLPLSTFSAYQSIQAYESLIGKKMLK